MPVERVTIEELKDEYLRCRGYSHDWDDFPNGTVDSDLFRAAYAYESLRCTRCHMERYKYLDRQMQPISRPYYKNKPPRYDTIVGQGTRPNMRNELFRRGIMIHRATWNGKRK